MHFSQAPAKPTIVFLMGPTAVGKTALAIKLRQQLPLELISVDSAMVYRGMNIGSGKPDQHELINAPHRLIDIKDPNEPYSAGNFREDALRHCQEILDLGKVPLLVGGTCLYFRALQYGIAELPAADPNVRQLILNKAEALGWQRLHDELKVIDPIAAARIHPHDKQRVQRALEVYTLSGVPLSDLQNQALTLPYQVLVICLLPGSRVMLEQKIIYRFEQMLVQGLISEVENLYRSYQGLAFSPAMRAVGYFEVSKYLTGIFSFTEMKKRAIIATRQLAKRQLTWLRHWEKAHYFASDTNDSFNQIADLIKNTSGC